MQVRRRASRSSHRDELCSWPAVPAAGLGWHSEPDATPNAPTKLAGLHRRRQQRARVARRGRAIRRRCFASDGTRLVMPAFGAFTGGLNVRDRAIAGLFGTVAFTAHMLGERRLYAFAADRCLPD